ncbi:MAG: GNAT family N-acetyltransferase [Alphaproteobacteria bacterium]|nr:GNAT family N-acetyltransferase [Alphaproteobacteria bacterium]
MEKNLLQKTLYEINQQKQVAGYKTIESDDGFIIVWNHPALYYYSKAHCNTLTEQNYIFFKKNYPFQALGIAANHRSSLENVHSDLIFNGTSDTMLLEQSVHLTEDSRYKIKLVENKEDIKIFAQIASEVFNHPEICENLTESLTADLKVMNCHKYIGYEGNEAAGIIELSEGEEAVFISWAAVRKNFRRKGLCHAMLAYAINREIKKNFTKFVLVSSSEGKIVYQLLGFKDFALRYNYTLECKKD